MIDDYKDIPVSSSVNPLLTVIREFYLVTLIINNIIERAHLFMDKDKAYRKYIDIWNEYNADKVIQNSEGETAKFKNGTVNIKKIRIGDKE